MKEALAPLVRKQSPQLFARSLVDSLLPCGRIADSDFSHTSGTKHFALSQKDPTSLVQTVFISRNPVFHRNSLISIETKTLQYPKIVGNLHAPVRGK